MSLSKTQSKRYPNYDRLTATISKEFNKTQLNFTETKVEPLTKYKSQTFIQSFNSFSSNEPKNKVKRSSSFTKNLFKDAKADPSFKSNRNSLQKTQKSLSLTNKIVQQNKIQQKKTILGNLSKFPSLIINKNIKNQGGYVNDRSAAQQIMNRLKNKKSLKIKSQIVSNTSQKNKFDKHVDTSSFSHNNKSNQYQNDFNTASILLEQPMMRANQNLSGQQELFMLSNRTNLRQQLIQKQNNQRMQMYFAQKKQELAKIQEQINRKTNNLTQMVLSYQQNIKQKENQLNQKQRSIIKKQEQLQQKITQAMMQIQRSKAIQQKMNQDGKQSIIGKNDKNNKIVQSHSNQTNFIRKTQDIKNTPPKKQKQSSYLNKQKRPNNTISTQVNPRNQEKQITLKQEKRGQIKQENKRQQALNAKKQQQSNSIFSKVNDEIDLNDIQEVNFTPVNNTSNKNLSKNSSINNAEEGFKKNKNQQKRKTQIAQPPILSKQGKNLPPPTQIKNTNYQINIIQPKTDPKKSTDQNKPFKQQQSNKPTMNKKNSKDQIKQSQSKQNYDQFMKVMTRAYQLIYFIGQIPYFCTTHMKKNKKFSFKIASLFLYKYVHDKFRYLQQLYSQLFKKNVIKQQQYNNRIEQNKQIRQTYQKIKNFTYKKQPYPQKKSQQYLHPQSNQLCYKDKKFFTQHLFKQIKDIIKFYHTETKGKWTDPQVNICYLRMLIAVFIIEELQFDNIIIQVSQNQQFADYGLEEIEKLTQNQIKQKLTDCYQIFLDLDNVKIK